MSYYNFHHSIEAWDFPFLISVDDNLAYIMIILLDHDWIKHMVTTLTRLRSGAWRGARAIIARHDKRPLIPMNGLLRWQCHYEAERSSLLSKQCSLFARQCLSAMASRDSTCLTHWGRDKMDAISQTTFSRASSSMKIVVFWLNFHWNWQ